MNKMELHNRFMSLAYQLSPENLTCDGELSAGQVRIKKQKIIKEWKELEEYAGRLVTEDDVWMGRV